MRIAGSSHDRTFVTMLTALVLLGVVALTSASGPTAYQKFGDAYWYVKHQVFFGILPGVLLFLIASRIDYRFWRTYAKPVYYLAIALLMAVFVPGLGADWGTSHSWLNIAGFSFQPIEVAKFGLLVFLAAWLETRGPEGLRDPKEGLLVFCAILGGIALPVLLQPDLGSLSVIIVAAFIVFFMAGAPWSHLAGLAGAGVLALLALIKSAPYRADRLMTFLHPEKDPLGIGYHINQAFLAIGSGGLFGLGLGHSRQKFMYLPEVVGDSIFAIFAEETGFVVSLLALALMGAFVWRITRIAKGAPDSFGRLLCIGIAGWLFAQMAFNIGSMVGLMPITGLPLPFVSYGGSSTLVLLFTMGVVSNIARTSGAPERIRR